MPSKRLTELRNLARKLKPLLKKYKSLKDIVFFGSFVKEKAIPKDIDIALLVNKKDKEIESIEKEIKNKIKHKIDFTILTIKDIYSNVWLSILKEGYSTAKNKSLHKLYRVQPSILYKYNLKSLNRVQKVQFDRGLKQILKETKGNRLTRTVVLIPLQLSYSFEEFLATWKIEYETRRYELLPELEKSKRILPV